jgi:hypothetical protein
MWITFRFATVFKWRRCYSDVALCCDYWQGLRADNSWSTVLKRSYKSWTVKRPAHTKADGTLRETACSRRLNQTGSQWRVTLRAQNLPNLDRYCPWRSLVPASGAQRETEGVEQAIEADWLTMPRDFKCADPSKTRPHSYAPVTRLTSYCPHTRRKSLLGMRYTRMRKISRQVTSCY